MYKNRSPEGKNNICGKKVAKLRNAMPEKTSQRKLADSLQLAGLDLDKNAVQRVESGQRFVTDIDLRTLARVLNVSYEALLEE